LKSNLLKILAGASLLFIMTSLNLYAETYMGLAYSGVTSGRRIPGLHIAGLSETARFSFISTGVKTPVYYHNAWQLGLFSTWKPGDLLWGELEAGFGGGFLHAVRGYRNNTDEEYERESNTVFGPAIYIGWQLFSGVMISLEALYGIRNTEALYLVFQENCAGSIGVRF
jgi:hypothetical protein